MSGSILVNKDELAIIDKNWINLLKEKARTSSNHRARLCLHRDDEEMVHEMIIAMTNECYFPPHRHKGKTESFHIIEGELYIIIFNDDGSPLKYIHMAPPDMKNTTFYYRMCIPFWHAVFPITDFVVFHETTNGPFRQNESEFANFAPKETEKLAFYLKTSIKLLKSKESSII